MTSNELKARKAQIRSEFAKFESADQLAAACLSIYGAIKATEARQPRLVCALLPALEKAIENWSEINELESDPGPASTEGGA
jgi:hypothetical protein